MKQSRRFLSLILVFMLMIGLMPATTFAAVRRPAKVVIVSAKMTSGAKVSVKWQGTACDGYQLQRCTTSSFESTKSAVFGSSATSGSISSGVKLYRSCYVRMRAYRLSGSTKVYGPWSSVVKVAPRLRKLKLATTSSLTDDMQAALKRQVPIP